MKNSESDNKGETTKGGIAVQLKQRRYSNNRDLEKNMRIFFTEPDNIDFEQRHFDYYYDDAVHISKVLRMECGDKIIVF